jgi:multisubunit Na+/H+ antiporter MnhB subunit
VTGTDAGNALTGAGAGTGAGNETTTGTVPGAGLPAGNPTAGGGVALGQPGGQAAQAPTAGGGPGGAGDPGSGESRSQPLQARAGFEEQSELITAVPTPSDISTDVKTIAQNVLLALALILLIGFPADIFNSTLAEHYDEITGWFRFGRRKRVGPRAENWFDRLPTPMRIGAIGFVGSILYGLLDSNFGFNRPSLILVLGLMLAIATISIVLDVLRIRYHRKVTRKRSRLKAYPLGLIMAAILVFFSRVGDFHPGYVFGIFTALAFDDELYDEEDGRGLAVAGVGLLVVAILALLLRAPLDRLAGDDGAGFFLLVLDAALATLWIAGIQAVIWGLIPISFMYGKKVLTWSKAGWFAIYGTGMLLFVHTLLHPGLGLYGNVAEASLFSVTALFLSFGAFSLLFWAYFRFRKPRRPKFEVVDSGDDRALVS